MASLLSSTSVPAAVRKQSGALPLHVSSVVQSLASNRTCNSFSTLCFQARLLQSRSSTRSSQPPLPLRQTRTFLTHLRRQAQAQKEQPVAPPTRSVPVKQAEQLQPALQLKNLPYFVRRTPSNQLPVYLVTKAGGTKQQTKIQKTEGDVDALRNDLARSLGVESSKEVTINRLNGHIIVKGWRKPEIIKFLTERNF